MADEISTQNAKPAARPMRKRNVAIIAAAALVLAGGITVVSVGAASAAAQQTARQCTVALKTGKAATSKVDPALKVADEALEKVKVVDLPGGEGWKSTSYAARPGADAVKAIPASNGVAAVTAKPARPSAASLINAVTADRGAVARIKIATTCTEREQAAEIVKAAKVANVTVRAIVADTKALLADYTTFQTDEHARVAAEVAAAKKAAEEEAARQAAAAAAAAQAAAEEAARRAASNNSGGGSKSGGGYSAPPPRGGGLVGGGVGSGGGGCKTSNGMGGTTNC